MRMQYHWNRQKLQCILFEKSSQGRLTDILQFKNNSRNRQSACKQCDERQDLCRRPICDSKTKSTEENSVFKRQREMSLSTMLYRMQHNTFLLPLLANTDFTMSFILWEICTVVHTYQRSLNACHFHVLSYTQTNTLSGMRFSYLLALFLFAILCLSAVHILWVVAFWGIHLFSFTRTRLCSRGCRRCWHPRRRWRYWRYSWCYDWGARGGWRRH